MRSTRFPEASSITSSSAGRQKGVMHAYRSEATAVECCANPFGTRSLNVLTAFAPLDSAGWLPEALCSFSVGTRARLLIHTTRQYADGIRSHIREHRPPFLTNNRYTGRPYKMSVTEGIPAVLEKQENFVETLVYV